MQLRDKRSETRAMVEAARAIKAALAPFAIPFVVNDRSTWRSPLKPTACISVRTT